MLAENRDNIRLGRATTRIISSEMDKSLKFCQRELAAQGETPQLDSLSDQLQRLYVHMQLHTPHSYGTRFRKTKPKGSSASDPPKSTPSNAEPGDSQRDVNGSAPLNSPSDSVQKQKSQSAATLNAAAKPFVPQMPREQQKFVNDSNPSTLEHLPLSPTAEKAIEKGAEPDSTTLRAPEKENAEITTPNGGSTEAEAIKVPDVQCLVDIKSVVTVNCSGEELPAASLTKSPWVPRARASYGLDSWMHMSRSIMLVCPKVSPACLFISILLVPPGWSGGAGALMNRFVSIGGAEGGKGGGCELGGSGSNNS